MELLVWLVNWGGTVGRMILLLKLVSFLSHSQVNRQKLCVFSLGLAVIDSVSNYVLHHVINEQSLYWFVYITFNTIILLVAMKFLLKRKLSWLIGLYGIAGILMTVGTFIVMGLFNLFSNNEGYIESIYLRSGLLVLPVVIFGLLSFGLMKIGFDEWFVVIYNNHKSRSIATLIFTGLLVGDYIIEYVDPDNLLGKGTIMYAFYWGVFGLMLGLVIYSWSSQLKLKYQEMIILEQKNYLHTLEDIQRDMGVLQHDYKNMLSGLYLQAEEGKIGEMQAYLSKIIGQVDGKVATKIKQTTHLSQVEITELKSLLFIKIMELDKKNIPIELEVVKPVQKVGMEIDNLVRCLGILIDNASEAIEGCRGSDRHGKMTVVLSQDEHNLTILVKNPVLELPILPKIWQAGFSSKGDNRGLGLHSYQEIINQYPNVWKQTICEEGQFTQILTIAHL